VIKGEIFKPPPLSNLDWPAILGAMGLGFCLSLLIFMDHNIAGAMVNSPDNRSLLYCCCYYYSKDPEGLNMKLKSKVGMANDLIHEIKAQKRIESVCDDQDSLKQVGTSCWKSRLFFIIRSEHIY